MIFHILPSNGSAFAGHRVISILYRMATTSTRVATFPETKLRKYAVNFCVPERTRQDGTVIVFILRFVSFKPKGPVPPT